ncbi:matrilin-2 isoform X1 [Hydra vulgaris]|uniref:matrilin-2 isoform X1 n=1 Tax=Hydra vulgaris TaxID=6087 RepID=UPI0006412F45|nr:matrilin-2 isoform X1 [Hydra vulgaris]XP_047143678.1 matrilin-2 isoform X1 [Hydra vulgaris]
MVAMYSLIIKICVYGFAICIVTSTDSLTLCFEKNCYSFIYCDLVDGKAVCSCPYGYNLQADNRSCVYDWCSWKSCEYICEVISDQAICSCPNGLYLQADGITCSVDYCKEKSCEYNCEMAFGQAVCSCPYGSFLQADGRSCSFDYCKEKSCEYNCEMAFGQAVCSCPYWSFLQADGRSCSFDYCKEKNCEYSCEMVSDQAVCLCPYGSFLQDDDKSCSFGKKLSAGSIVLIVFGVAFISFLPFFFVIFYHYNKRFNKLAPTIVRFDAETQSTVVQGLARNQYGNVDI